MQPRLTAEFSPFAIDSHHQDLITDTSQPAAIPVVLPGREVSVFSSVPSMVLKDLASGATAAIDGIE